MSNHPKPTYPKLALIQEMKSALLPFSELYEVLYADEGHPINVEIDGTIELQIKADDLRKAHFFCRHKSVHDHLVESL